MTDTTLQTIAQYGFECVVQHPFVAAGTTGLGAGALIAYHTGYLSRVNSILDELREAATVDHLRVLVSQVQQNFKKLEIEDPYVSDDEDLDDENLDDGNLEIGSPDKASLEIESPEKGSPEASLEIGSPEATPECEDVPKGVDAKVLEVPVGETQENSIFATIRKAYNDLIARINDLMVAIGERMKGFGTTVRNTGSLMFTNIGKGVSSVADTVIESCSCFSSKKTPA